MPIKLNQCNKKKLINICGTARSGSTMVDLMLGNDERSFSLGEVHAWFRPFRSHHFKIICSCGKEDCPWGLLKRLKEKEFYKKCYEILDIDVLVDSSKNLPWVIDNNLQLENKDIAVFNILLYKDPVSFMYSFWKRGMSIDKARDFEFIRYYKRFFTTNLSYIPLNYNRLIAEPEAILKQLCNMLDIPYFEGKEKFWEKKHHHLFGSMGTRKQIGKANAVIKQNEEYPEEFKRLIPGIEVDNEKNAALRNIVARLKANEMKPVSFRDKKIRKPFWYYLSKVKQKVKQRFPEEWKYVQ